MPCRKFAKMLVRVWNRDKKKMSSMFAPLRFGNCRLLHKTRTFLFCTRSYTISLCRAARHLMMILFYIVAWYLNSNLVWNGDSKSIYIVHLGTKKGIGIQILHLVLFSYYNYPEVPGISGFYSKPRACKYGFFATTAKLNTNLQILRSIVCWYQKSMK